MKWGQIFLLRYFLGKMKTLHLDIINFDIHINFYVHSFLFDSFFCIYENGWLPNIYHPMHLFLSRIRRKLKTILKMTIRVFQTIWKRLWNFSHFSINLQHLLIGFFKPINLNIALSHLRSHLDTSTQLSNFQKNPFLLQNFRSLPIVL